MSIPFGEANHFIPLAQAKAMTAKYRNEKETILLPELQNKNILLISETFDREAFDTLLAQEGTVALRVYFGMAANQQVRAIVVSVDADNKDIVPSGTVSAMAKGEETANAEDDDDGKIVEDGRPCPDFCAVPPL